MLLGRVQATRLASCLHPRVIVHSDFKCATTISSLHQIPCISSFLKCQACLLSDVNDYGPISKKYLLLVLFQRAYYRVTCGGNAVLPSREGCAVSNSVLGVMITIKLHCIGDLSHGSEEQEQWDVKINVW